MSEQQIQKVKVKRLAHIGLWTTDALAQARFISNGVSVR